MKKGTTIALWVLTVFFAISALLFFPSFASLFAILLVGVVLPIPKWQNILAKFIRGKLKAVIAVVLALLTIFTAPTSGTKNASQTDSTIATEQTATSEKEIPTDPETTPETIPSTSATVPSETESATAPTTEPPHTHDFSAATCTEPMICSCGATEGAAIGHEFSKGKCAVCGEADPDYENETIVWIPTKGGTKYHTYAGCSNMDNPKEVTEEEAIALGFTPCKKCH